MGGNTTEGTVKRVAWLVVGKGSGSPLNVYRLKRHADADRSTTGYAVVRVEYDWPPAKRAKPANGNKRQ